MTPSTRAVRLIPRLDVKGAWLIKGVQMEGWRKVGDPAAAAERYAAAGADELLFVDVVASLYGRNTLGEVLEGVARRVFVPITAGGGVRSVDDAGALLEGGADKVAVNTAATRRPELIGELADAFGAQATVVAIEAVRAGEGWRAMTDNGRNPTGLDAVEWAVRAEALGAGELVVTSVDRDGSGKGYDVGLVQEVSARVRIPVVASGGLGAARHLDELLDATHASGAAVAGALHWERLTLGALRSALQARGCYVRPLAPVGAPEEGGP